MTFETRQAYSEVYTVLENMPKEYRDKIPNKILELFENEKLDNYEVNINKDNPLDKSYLSRKTMVLIAMLNYQYWCPNKKVKDELLKIYESNNEKYKKEIEERYNTDNLFKKRENNKEESKELEKCTALQKYKESYFIKILIIIKKFFRK